MAKLLNVLLFIGSGLLIMKIAVVIYVPNLISYTLCISMTDLKKIMDSMAPKSGTQMSLPALMVESNSPSCDFEVSVSLGIWRYRMESTDGPTEGAWGGFYSNLGDDIKNGFKLMKPPLDKMGVVKMMLGDKAGDAIGDLVATVTLRFEIQITLALVFAVIALWTSSVSMREKEGQREPLIVTCSVLSHVIAAILLGVTLGAFAQQLHQISLLGDIYTMIKITDQGYGFLVLGFVAVLTSILLAVTHLLVLVSNLKKQEERKPDVEYNLLVQNEDSP